MEMGQETIITKTLKEWWKADMSMSDLIDVKMELSTFAVFIAGLYCHYSMVDPVAIPESLYIEIAEKLLPYLKKWNYDKITLEQWLKYNLLIIPKVLVEGEIDDFKKNDLYFERDNGNVMLIVTADMSEVVD